MPSSIRSLLLAALLCLGVSAFAVAQPGPGPAPRGVVRGTVLDAGTGRPLPSATVSLWSPADSSLVTGVITTADGAFLIEGLRPGRYYLKASFVGYTSRTVEPVALAPDAPAADLGAIRLEPDTRQLGDVQVVAEREQVQFSIDRTVYNTKDQPATSGGTATDVLRNLPSVEVDADGRVSLRGSQNVAVQINGRPAPMRGEFLAAYLQQLPAHLIERVEVIPNPSAKYDPDGMAGILNIVLRQDADLGTSAGFIVGAGTGDKYNASTNVGYQRGAWTLTAGYSYRNEQRGNTGSNFRENRFGTPTTFIDQQLNGFNVNRSHMVNGNLERRLGRRDVLTGSLMLSSNGFGNDGTNAYRLLGADRGLTGRYDRLNETDFDGANANASLAFKRTIEASRHELSAELRYSRTAFGNASRFTEQLLDLEGRPVDDTPALQAHRLDTRNGDAHAQLDYTRPLFGGLKLETGYKGQLRQVDNDFFAENFDYEAQAYRPDARLNNRFVFDEQIHAAYGVLSRGFGKVDLQAGLRLEQALTTFDLTTTTDVYDNDYFSAFPSAILAYKPTEAQQLRLSYSKRIERPQLFFLNPFPTYEDPLNLFVGNPYLKPEYIHAFEAAYQRFGARGSLSLTPFFRRTTDAIRRYKTVDESGVSTMTFRNLQTADSYGAEVIGQLRLGRKLNGFLSFNANRLVTDGSNVEDGLGSDALVWSTRANATWQVTPALDVQLFWFYRAPMEMEQGRISAFSMSNVAVRQKVLDDRGSISLRLQDPFNTMGFSFETEDAFHFQRSRRKFESRVLFLTFSYNVGQQPRIRNRPEGEQAPQGQPDIGLQ